MNKNNVIEVQNLTVCYNAVVALHDITVTIKQGNMVGIVGPNGGGKSTFIKALLGLVRPLAGIITLDPAIQKHNAYAYVPQRASIDWDFPLSVYDVVMMGRLPHQPFYASSSTHDHKVVQESLRAVNMLDVAHKPIGDLSGGQQQRTFIARALAQESSIYVLDEPFNNVDAATEKIVINVLQNLTRNNKTVLMVHHNMYTCASYFDTLLYIDHELKMNGPTHQVCDIILSMLKG